MNYYGENELGMVDVKDSSTYMTNSYPAGFAKVNLPDGISSDWCVEKFNVTEEEVRIYNLRLIRDGRSDRVVPPGSYTRLVHKGQHDSVVVMSDTPAEAHEHARAFAYAEGNVLINGLGLGFFLQALINKESVAKITVIEKSLDVIKLVKPTFANVENVDIVNMDALVYEPPKYVCYDFVWHDIWTYISEDNAHEMGLLRKKYYRKSKRQACWSEEYL